MKHSRKRGIARALKVVKGVSPVLAVLLMIAITVIAAIVAYMWLMGYFSSTTSKIDKAIQIQSAAYTGSHLAIYVQNVGKGTVRFVASQCLYVDGVLRDKATINPDTLQETTTAMVIEEISLSLSQTIKIKVVTDEGIFVEATVTIETFTGDYALTMLVIGSGSVTMVPSGSLYYYDNVQLTALPDSHWRFLRWEGDVSGSANPASIYVDGDKSVTVVFEQYQFQVAFSHSGLDNTATGTVVSVTIGIDMYQESFADLPFTTPWLDTGTVATYSYTPTVLSSAPDKQFVLAGVTGPASPITVTTSETVTGNYGARYYLTVSSPYATASGEGWYDSGTPAYARLDTNVVDHGNGTRRVFAEWSGDATGTDYTQSDAITMDASKTAVALWRTQYSVSFAVDPIVGGTTDPGTDNWYNEGVSGVQISATSNIGYGFSTWSSSTPDISITMESDPSTTMTINGPGTVTAHFTRIEYALVLNVNPGGSGTITPDNPGPYYYGDVVQLTAQGNLGWGFFSWSGDLGGSNNPENIVIDGDKSVTASFSQQTFVIHASAGQHGDISPSGDVVVVYGNDQSFDFIADPNYRVEDVVVDGASQGPIDSYTFTSVITDHTIVASFGLNEYPLVVNIVGSGTVTKNPDQATYHYNDLVQLTANPSSGWTFSGWSVDLTGSTNPDTVTIDETPQVTATFTQIQFTLTINVSPSGWGTVTKNPDRSMYDLGTVVQLMAIPSNGRRFIGWSGDLTGSTNPTSITMSSDKTVTATFATGTATSMSWYTWPDQVTLGADFSSIGVLSPGLNGRTIYLTFTKPDGTKILSTTTTGWFIFNGVFYAQTTPDVIGTWSVSATFLGDSTYGAFTTPLRTFAVVPVPQYTVSFTQTGAGVAPTVTYHIDSGSDQQGTVPFDVMVNEDSTIYYAYQTTVPGATNIQYVLANTNPSSPETITGAETITGTYNTQYYVTFAVNPPGTGTINRATNWYNSGSLSITATANSGYTFSSWSSDTPSITFVNSGSSTTTATIGGAGTITANFRVKPPSHFVDTMLDLHAPTDVGTHSNFPAMQAGPDGTYDTLTETNTGGTSSWRTPSSIEDRCGDESGSRDDNAIDGDTGSYWRHNTNHNHWIEFDLGQSFDITRVRIYQSTTSSNRWGYGGTVSVYVSDDPGNWGSAVLTGWNPASSSGWVESSTFSAKRGRYIRLEEVGVSSPSSHRMYEFNAYATPINYQLNLEAQFAGVTDYGLYTQLCIQTGTLASENIRVDYWNGASWVNLRTNLNSNSLNVITVSLTGPTFEIRFMGGSESSDTTQSSWQVDCVYLNVP